MEWPALDTLSGDENILTMDDEQYLENMTMMLITKEIYARAANAAVSNILIDHEDSGLKARVDAFLEHLRSDDNDTWNTEFRSVTREFTELMAAARPRSRTLEICRAGLDAVHDLLKYRLPNEDKRHVETVLVAKDAFVLCQSLEKLHSQFVTGTRAPDLDFRFGLLTRPPANHEFADADEFTLYGMDACRHVNKMRSDGQLETSAASLANHTLTNPDLVARLAHKTFVVIGCDHQLSPTQSLLRIPGVTVLGIPSSRQGLEQVLGYATYNTPDDTTFVYPTISGNSEPRDEGNLVLTRGPHVAQWILENTRNNNNPQHQHSCNPPDHTVDSELVLVPMPLPKRSDRVGPNEEAIRWAASTDLIVQRVLRARTETTRCSVWSYQSSTTCMVVPSASSTQSTELLQSRPAHEQWLHTLSMRTILTPAMNETSGSNNRQSPEDKQSSAYFPDSSPTVSEQPDPNANHDYSIVNGILTLEGPHHVLAEHIRMWRAMVTNYPYEYHQYLDEEYDSDDEDEDPNRNVHVFAPYVPLLQPDLVSSDNARLLDPLRIFDRGSASSLMCAIALAGLVDPIINRPMPVFEDADVHDGIEPSTPFSMFWNGSVHGGIWNCPYTLDSASGVTGYVLGKLYEYYHHYRTPNAAREDEVSPSSPTALAKGTIKVEAKKAIVEAIPPPSDDHHEMPDFVQERLEMVAGP